MAIVADFTADITSGGPGTSVSFTDLSGGSPTNWFWEFGDGFTSDAQNPSHIYENEGSYTVSLKAFDSTGTITRTAVASVTQKRLGNSINNFEEAFTSFEQKSWEPFAGIANVYRVVKQNSTNWVFSAFRATLTFDLSSDSGKIIIIKGAYRTLSNIIDASNFQNVAGFSFGKVGGNAYVTWYDASENAGGNHVLTPSDLNGYAILPNIGGILDKVGWEMVPDPFNGAKAIVHSFSTQSTETKTNHIVIGTPTANFSLIPSSGRSPLSVVFTNQSSNENTYSWRRRISGSGNAFVEYSTQENPTEIFDKGNP